MIPEHRDKCSAGKTSKSKIACEKKLYAFGFKISSLVLKRTEAKLIQRMCAKTEGRETTVSQLSGLITVCTDTIFVN
jgi:acetolactate synthase small subunit